MDSPSKMPTILIVEDEAPLRRAIKIKLGQSNFNVLEAKNGKEGLETALAEHPDLILLDIVMPVMDGLHMLKELRRDAWGKDVEVIFLTNLGDNENLDEAVEGSATAYLIKTDWKLEDVVGKIKQHLKIEG